MAIRIQSQMRPAQVLIVEDNRMDVYFIKEALRHSKMMMIFDAVDDGSKALAYLRRQAGFVDAPEPDLVLLDLSLPGEKGWVVLEEVKGNSGLSSIPVIILTGSHNDEDAERARDGNVDLYIVKPLDVSNFQLLVKSVERLLVKKFQNEEQQE